MAENRQQLIHLHSANVNTTPFDSLMAKGFQAGEIAIQYAASAPKLFILDDADVVREFIDKAAIETLVNGVAGDVEELENRVTALETTVGDETKGLVKGLADEIARAEKAEADLLGDATAVTVTAATIYDVKRALAAEVTRAEGAEAVLDGKIDDVEAAYKAADTALGARIDGVDAAYKAADTALGNRIKAFETDGAHDVAALEGRVGANEGAIELLNGADDVEGSVAYAVKAEADRAEAAEKVNANAITAETSSRQSADEALGERIDNVITAYTAADATVLADAKSYTDGKVSSVYRYKGSVPTYDDLPTTGLTVGDVYNVVAAYGTYPEGTNFAWTGSEWDPLGGPVDLSSYALKTEVEAVASDLADEVARATSAETANANAITAETSSRQSADEALGARLNVIEGADTVNGSIKKALKDAKAYTDVEQLRAEGAEQILTTNLANEITRATTAETALGVRIDNIVAGMTTVEAANAAITIEHTSGSSVYKVGVVVDSDAFLKIDSAKGLQVVGVAKDTDLTAVANRVTALETTVGDENGGLVKELADEIVRAKAAEQKNATGITANANAIDAEVTRATSAETALGTRITNEVNRATDAEGDLDDKIDGVAADLDALDKAVVKSVTIATGKAAGVTVTTGQNPQFDFSNMVINCGEF